jgi:hypothetical protein
VVCERLGVGGGERCGRGPRRRSVGGWELVVGVEVVEGLGGDLNLVAQW